jgi:hypothetical protein
MSGLPVMSSSSGNAGMMSMISEQKNMLMGSQPMYTSSFIDTTNQRNQYPSHRTGPSNPMMTMNMYGMRGPNVVVGDTMNSGGLNPIQAQPSMNASTMMMSSTPPMVNIPRDSSNFSTMGYNHPNSDMGSNRMGGAPMGGW